MHQPWIFYHEKKKKVKKNVFCLLGQTKVMLNSISLWFIISFKTML